MGYSVRRIEEKREEFGPYRYEILRNDQLVATYWHDFRGDDHGIEFADGTTDQLPFGRVTDFLTDAGPHLVGLSDSAISYLKEKQEGRLRRRSADG